ncbi:MAG: tetratricopeptide repeat protein [Treponema sp.]|jgi:tetratricopeptide (TPR) repeat protein|nr:tetratricopeptide repeat protein [Treponema sp.]
MKETKRVSRLLLERYRLDDVSEEQRKLVEAELAADEELRLYYESLEASDSEINRLYPFENFPALTAFRDNAVPADKPRPPKMKETKRVSRLMLERYRLGNVSDEQRKLVEAELATDEELRHYYESLEASDNEINRLYPYKNLPALTAFRDNAVPAAKGRPVRTRAGRLQEWRPARLAAAVARNIVSIILVLCFLLNVMTSVSGVTFSEVGAVTRASGNPFQEADVAKPSKVTFQEVIIKIISGIYKILPGGKYLLSGNAHYSNGEYDLAIEDYTRAIKVYKNFGHAYYNRGDSYYAKGEYDLAINDYNQVIGLNPFEAIYYNGRGDSYYAKGDYDLAIEDYSRAIFLDSNYVLVQYVRGPIYGALFHYNRAYAYYYKDEYDLAIEDFTRAINLNPNEAIIYESRGDAYYAKGEHERANEDYETARRLVSGE